MMRRAAAAIDIHIFFIRRDAIRYASATRQYRVDTGVILPLLRYIKRRYIEMARYATLR